MYAVHMMKTQMQLTLPGFAAPECRFGCGQQGHRITWRDQFVVADHAAPHGGQCPGSGLPARWSEGVVG